MVCSYLKMLYWFLPYNKGHPLYAWVYPFPVRSPSTPTLDSTHLGHHGAPRWSPCAQLQVPTHYLPDTRQWPKLNPSLPTHPPRTSRPVSTCSFCSLSLSLFLPYKEVPLYHFSRFYIYTLIYICFSVPDCLHSVWQTRCSSTSLQMTQLHSSFSWVIFHCIYVSYLLYPFICWWTFSSFPCPVYCK